MGLIAGVVHLSDSTAAPAGRDVSVAFDGTILNLAELAAELHEWLETGTRRPAADPTDVIVAGYRAWGGRVFSRLRGSFAVALWDARDRILLLARDRAGVKPLHYAVVNNRLFFASDTKALLNNAGLAGEIDPAALDHYLAFLLTPRDRSIVRGVRTLPPAHILRLQNGTLSLEQYWRLPLEERFHGTESDAVAQLDELLRDAVVRQLAQDPGTGLLLSGGPSSSLLAGIAARAAGHSVRTFTVRVDGADTVDVDAAGTVARHLGTDHHELRVRADAGDVVDLVLPSLDEPCADASVIPWWHLARETRAHTPAVLSGDGHEIFGGCDRYLPPARVAAFDRVAGRPGRTLAGLAARVLPDSAPGGNFIRHVALSDRERYLAAMCFCAPDVRRNLVAREMWPADGDRAEATFGAPFLALDHLPWPAQMMAFDFQVELPEDILAPRGRMATAHGLTCHAPLLDHHVVELAATLPVSLRIRGHRLKHVLREVAGRYLPPALVDRPSRGFGLSPAAWVSGDVFGDVLGSAPARQRGYLNQPLIGELLREHLAGTRDHTQLLWALVVLEQWQQAVTSRQLLPIASSW